MEKSLRIKMATIVFGLLFPFLVGLALFIMYREGVFLTKVHLPDELNMNKQIFLGQRISKVAKEIELTHGRSSTQSCYGKIKNNRYFESISLDTETYTLNLLIFFVEGLFGSNAIKNIAIAGPPKENLNNVDSLSKEIIEICKNTFGDGYKITDYYLYFRDNITLPRLIWETDTCTVILKIMPYNVYKELDNEKKSKRFSGYTLLMTYYLEKSRIDLTESSFWTREKLGLD